MSSLVGVLVGVFLLGVVVLGLSLVLTLRG